MTHNEPSFDASAIVHPLHADYLQSGLNLMADRESSYQQALRTRFGESDERLPYLVESIGAISLQLDSVRATHERTNVHVLRAAASGVVSPEELDKYTYYAGKPELAGEYIVWFGRVATAAYFKFFRLEQENPEKFRQMIEGIGVQGAKGRENFLKIGLDLGGQRQAGDWNGTNDLDTYANGLGGMIKDVEHAAKVDVCAPNDQKRGYKLYPRYRMNKDGWPERDLTSVTIRRRRRHSVVRIPNLRELLVIKESTGWIQLDEVENDRQRVVIEEALADWDPAIHGAEDTPVAKVGGKVFERAISNRNRTREVVPLNAHHYVLASVDLPIVQAA